MVPLFRRGLGFLSTLCLLLTFTLGASLLTSVPQAQAAADDYTVSGGNPGALPDVGAAAVSLPTLTLTDVGGDDFTNDPETLRIEINTTNYPNVVFDQTITTAEVTIGGSCGFTTDDSVTFNSATQVDIAVSAGTSCSDTETITIAGLTIQTIFAATAPGAAALVIVDNETTSDGAPVSTSDTVNLAVSAADANASLALASGIVGATQNSTLSITISAEMGATDTIVFDLPLNVNGTAVFSSETFDGGGTFSSCTGGTPTVTCTAGGQILPGTGTIIITGLSGQFAATTQTITNITVVDTGNGNIGTDASGTVTDTTVADLAMSVTLGSTVVGAAQTTTFSSTLPVALGTGDTVAFDLPANFGGTAVFASDTFAGAGAFTCAGGSPTVTCTSTGVIDAGTGDILITGITGQFVDTAQTITNGVATDTGNGALATDASGTIPDTTVADLAMSVTLGSTVVGAAQTTTFSSTLPVALGTGDTVAFDLPANFGGTAVFASDTFAGAGAFTCAGGSPTVTCTSTGVIDAGTGDILITGITGQFVDTAQTITNGVATDTGNGALATDASGTIPDTTVADLAMSVTLGSTVVGAAQTTTFSSTLP
ncbi:MAG: hypothetical protein P1V18_04005, partial [Candidatus Gracilibacteria bacterium]|nr:hypothetical protein [Candidatus Gracilibacteria bacterium]